VQAAETLTAPLATESARSRWRASESLLEDKSRRIEPGLVIDFGRGGQPIGIEITTPQKLSLAALNRVLRQFGFAPVKRAELATVLAA